MRKAVGDVQPTTPTSIDLRGPAVGIHEVEAALDRIAADLRPLWSSAMERGDFEEITRLSEAGQAVHSAVIALRGDSELAVQPQPG